MANCSHLVVKSRDTIPKAVDRAMDSETPSNGHVEPGVSIRMGPVENMDVDEPVTNGKLNGKRKSRGSLNNNKTYKEASGSEEEQPLVRSAVGLFTYCVR
jgi:DNA topoisomerase-1